MTKNDCGKNIKELAADENTALKINAGKTKSAGDSDGFKSYLNKKRKKITLEEYLEGIKSGDRVIIGRALTLIESKRRDDNEMSKIIINNCLPRSGKSVRIGITGVPGAGKSTFIESLGLFLLSLGKKVAVMAVDPSSSKSG
ncbi:MAG TPA: ATP/GTP-binding protein, partial [Clostridiales bacterium]|nr:ATP/GTP-binding protein [Clostridiales bacterium]